MGKEYTALVRELAAFDPRETLAIVGGLLMLPEFHANSSQVVPVTDNHRRTDEHGKA